MKTLGFLISAAVLALGGGAAVYTIDTFVDAVGKFTTDMAHIGAR